MKFTKMFKKEYDKLPVPEGSRVVPGYGEGKNSNRPTRRWLRPALSFAVLAVFVTAVALIAFRAPTGGITGSPDSASPELSVEAEAVSQPQNSVGEAASYGDGVIGGREDASYAYEEGYYAREEGYGAPVPTGEKDHALSGKASASLEYAPEYGGDGYPYPTDEDWIDGYVKSEYYGRNEQIRAGLLTAGEWRDTDSLDEWIKQFEDKEWASYSKNRGLYAYNVIAVKVTNGGSAVCGIPVELRSADGQEVLYAAKTDIFGKAYLVWAEKDVQKIGKVVVNGEEETVSASKRGQTVEIETSLEGVSVTELDLMLMVDTTGSMSDELEYLKAELRDMVERVGAGSDVLSIRVSVNFYRDEGDEYVVKYFDFRPDIDECAELIKAQQADGGGDYPEAVHTALENAVNGHGWREDAVKLCFMVLDAPPHDESEIQGINTKITNTLKDAAQKGVKIIPVASSGVDKDTEVLLRSYAVMTGGTYIFLTTHSGIGGNHIEASVGEYDVEPLNECMIRVVCEYCGLEYTAPAVNEDPVEESSYVQ